MNKKLKVQFIVAFDKDWWIWKDWTLPWKLKDDLKRFKEITSEVEENGKINALIMGRKTWESLPKKPLTWRLNCVISSQKQEWDNFKKFYKNIFECLTELWNLNEIENIFVIWWASIYNEFLQLHKSWIVEIEIFYITIISGSFNCDTFLNTKEISEILEDEDYFSYSEGFEKDFESWVSFNYLKYFKKNKK